MVALVSPEDEHCSEAALLIDKLEGRMILSLYALTELNFNVGEAGR